MAQDGSFRKKVCIVTAAIVIASAVALAVIAAGSLSGITLLASYNEYSTHASFDVPSQFNLSVSSNNSNLQFIQGTNNSLFVSLNVSGWLKFSENNVYISESATGNSISLVIETPRSPIPFTSNARIYVPAGAEIGYFSASTVNGNVNTNQSLNTTAVSISSTNGNIYFSSLSSNTVQASTVNGNINIQSPYLGGCVASSTNGNVQVSISEHISSGTFTLNSVNGNQDLVINRSSNASFSISTVNGNIVTDSISIAVSVSTAHTLVGTANGGGASITMSATNGNIKVTGS